MNALFSDCGKFRHLIWDVWDASLPVLAWVLFNPSQAGREVDGERVPDPTWTKGLGFSKRLGYGGQVFANPYDFISTDPEGLRRAGYPSSPQNDGFILQACRMGDGKVVCGWGALGRGLERPPKVLAMIRQAGFQPMALGFTADRLPRHPLMLSYKTALVPIPPPASTRTAA